MSVVCWVLISIYRLSFPPGVSIAIIFAGVYSLFWKTVTYGWRLTHEWLTLHTAWFTLCIQLIAWRYTWKMSCVKIKTSCYLFTGLEKMKTDYDCFLYEMLKNKTTGEQAIWLDHFKIIMLFKYFICQYISLSFLKAVFSYAHYQVFGISINNIVFLRALPPPFMIHISNIKKKRVIHEPTLFTWW